MHLEKWAVMPAISQYPESTVHLGHQPSCPPCPLALPLGSKGLDREIKDVVFVLKLVEVP